MRVNVLVLISIACLSCFLFGCSTTPTYGVGTRGELKPFETPEELIRSYNNSYSVGCIPAVVLPSGEYFGVRLLPDMLAYYTPFDEAVAPDLDAISRVSSATFELIYAVDDRFGKMAASSEGFRVNMPLPDWIDLSTLKINDDETAAATGHVSTNFVGGFKKGLEPEKQELAYSFRNTSSGWKIVFFDEPLGDESFGRALVMGCSNKVASCWESLANEIQAGKFRFAGEAKKAMQDCMEPMLEASKSWAENRRRKIGS